MGVRERTENPFSGSNFVTFYWNLYTGGIYLLNVIHRFFFELVRRRLVFLFVCVLSLSFAPIRCECECEREARQCFCHLHSETFQIFIRRLKSRHRVFFWQIAIYGFEFAARWCTRHTDALVFWRWHSEGMLGFRVPESSTQSYSEMGSFHLLVAFNIFFSLLIKTFCLPFRLSLSPSASLSLYQRAFF